MKLGLIDFATDRSLDPALLARRAEALGFSSFFLPEHHVLPVWTTTAHPATGARAIPESFGRLLDPFVALGRISAVTSTLELGTGVCLVPQHHPVRLAKAVATLDQLCGGRLLFGVGTGWLREESEVMGVDFARRWTQTTEAIFAMKELWTRDVAEFHGKYYDFPPSISFPKPSRKPHPPILVGAIASERAFARVLDWGGVWMPANVPMPELVAGCARLRELADERGIDPDSVEIVAFGIAGEYRTRSELEQLEAAGVGQTLIWLERQESSDALDELDELAAH